jgi:flagellar motility protein MotE (MotC chaperone)
MKWTRVPKDLYTIVEFLRFNQRTFSNLHDEIESLEERLKGLETKKEEQIKLISEGRKDIKLFLDELSEEERKEVVEEFDLEDVELYRV